MTGSEQGEGLGRNGDKQRWEEKILDLVLDVLGLQYVSGEMMVRQWEA